MTPRRPHILNKEKLDIIVRHQLRQCDRRDERKAKCAAKLINRK